MSESITIQIRNDNGLMVSHLLSRIASDARDAEQFLHKSIDASMRANRPALAIPGQGQQMDHRAAAAELMQAAVQMIAELFQHQRELKDALGPRRPAAEIGNNGHADRLKLGSE